MLNLSKIDVCSTANENSKTFIFINFNLIYEADSQSAFEMIEANNLFLNLSKTNEFEVKSFVLYENSSINLNSFRAVELLSRQDLIQI